MTNNTTHQEIIDLFPDNTDNSISAEDMRLSMNGIFTDREVKVVKISDFSDLPLALNIYEGTLVIVYQGTDTGLYLSLINQPQQESELITICKS